jgi:hypothetical protein
VSATCHTIVPLIVLLGPLGLTIAFLQVGRGRGRKLAVVSAGTLAGIVLFVPAGGPILMASWLAAGSLRS